MGTSFTKLVISLVAFVSYHTSCCNASISQALYGDLTYWVDASCYAKSPDFDKAIAEAKQEAQDALDLIEEEDEYFLKVVRAMLILPSFGPMLDMAKGPLLLMTRWKRSQSQQAAKTRIYCDNDARFDTSIPWLQRDKANMVLTGAPLCYANGNERLAQFYGFAYFDPLSPRNSWQQNWGRRTITICDRAFEFHQLHVGEDAIRYPERMELLTDRDLTGLHDALSFLDRVLSSTIFHELIHALHRTFVDWAYSYTDCVNLGPWQAWHNSNTYTHLGVIARLLKMGYAVKGFQDGEDVDPSSGILKAYQRPMAPSVTTSTTEGRPQRKRAINYWEKLREAHRNVRGMEFRL